MAYKKLKYWFDGDLAVLLARKISSVHANFNAEEFISDVKEGVENLELKPRVRLIAECLRSRLPTDYRHALGILVDILGPELEGETGMFTEGYWVMPIAAFVEHFGLEDFDSSVEAIAEITKRNTGEYCIRPFIRRYPDQTLAVMGNWALHENVHLRRLSSEGLRPRLPWATKLEQFIGNPSPILPILDTLKDDPSRFVQTSVANNLNDILKDNYEIGIKVIGNWAADPTNSRRWTIRHALRNQKKAGDRTALRILNVVG